MSKNLIYKLRIEKGLSSYELAQMVGVKSPTVCKWENGAIIPSEPKLAKLADALDIDYETLNAISPRCTAACCTTRAYQEGLCKKHFHKRYHKSVKPIITEDMYAAKTIGERIKLLRQKRSLTPETLAQQFGVTVSTVEAWECNWVQPTLHMLLDIAPYFGVSTRFLERGTLNDVAVDG